MPEFAVLLSSFDEPMKVLVVGNGGREHALAWKIRQSPLVSEVYCAPGNGGMASFAHCVPIDTSNIIEVADFAQTIRADLTVVGPELPMVLGMGDEFRRRGLSIFCPSRAAADTWLQPSPRFHAPARSRRYESAAPSRRSDSEAGALGYPSVMKADWPAQGRARSSSAIPRRPRRPPARMRDRKFGTAGAKLVMEGS